MDKNRFVRTVKSALPGAWKTVLWLSKITVIVSFGVMLMRHFGILPVIAGWLDTVFSHMGLTGDSALAYVTGYFVNVYAAISVAVTLGLDSRAMTILAVMVLCSHNMIVESTVQKKTGSPFVRILITRTLSAFVLAFTLNAVLPESSGTQTLPQAIDGPLHGSVAFTDALVQWAMSAVGLIVKMAVLVVLLNILQKILTEYGIIAKISRFLHPLLRVFGLPRECSLLWIIANTLGLAYGAAAIIGETSGKALPQRYIDLLNVHISISHSNLEDLLLFVAIGGLFWPMLLSRWAMSFILVWELRFEYWLIDYISKKRTNFAS